MKNLLFTLTLLIAMLGGISANATGDEKVYVCPSGKVYHKNMDCSGAKSCKTLKEGTLAEAEKEGRTQCKKCSKTSAAAPKKTKTTKTATKTDDNSKGSQGGSTGGK